MSNGPLITPWRDYVSIIEEVNHMKWLVVLPKIQNYYKRLKISLKKFKMKTTTPQELKKRSINSILVNLVSMPILAVDYMIDV